MGSPLDLSLYLHQPAQRRQRHGHRWDIGHQQESDQDDQEVGQQFLHHAFDGHLAHLAAGEQDRADRRSDGADAQVIGHHDAEVDGAYAKAFAHRQEDGGKDQDHRGGIHERAHDQDNDVHHDQDHIFVAGEGQDAAADQVRDAGKGHAPGHDGGKADHEGDDAGHFR